jgi:hypothetical protein
MSLSLPDERFARSPVKALMSRAKYAFVLLMPAAFWLFASGQSLLVSCNECGAISLTGSQGSVEPGKNCAGKLPTAFDAVARPIHLRVLKQGGKSTPAPCDLAPRSISSRPSRMVHVVPQPVSSDFASSWLFDCRVARNPRAPSFVS